MFLHGFCLPTTKPASKSRRPPRLSSLPFCLQKDVLFSQPNGLFTPVDNTSISYNYSKRKPFSNLETKPSFSVLSPRTRPRTCIPLHLSKLPLVLHHHLDWLIFLRWISNSPQLDTLFPLNDCLVDKARLPHTSPRRSPCSYSSLRLSSPHPYLAPGL